MNVLAPDAERQIWIYTQMLRIREFEERVKRTFTEHPGVIRGHTHLADGTEASIVGSLCHFRKGDAALATYRCHGYPLVLGSDPKAVMAEIYGRADGLCKGLGGSMHLTDVQRGFLAPQALSAPASRTPQVRPGTRRSARRAKSSSATLATARRSKVPSMRR